MRSVYARIMAWSLLTLAISLLGFFFVTNRIAMQLGFLDVFPRLQTLEIEQAEATYESGGPAKLAVFIARLNSLMGARHHFLDLNAKDLATGSTRPDLFARVGARWNQPISIPEGMMIGSHTADGRYALIIETPVHFQPWTFLPYYGLIFLAVALLCWPLAMNIGSPLRSLARTVDRFGQGDLSIRAQSSRRDEIGALAASFDRMADRIETLLTAERRLLQDVSHELRSPLARLSFAAELVRTAPDQDQAVARLRKEIARLSDLVGTLLQMTRAEGDPASGERKEFALDKLLADVVEDCSVEAAARHCEITFARNGGISMIGDPELMRRAVENVLRNAVTYSPENASIDVGLKTDHGAAQVEIRDRGPGVPGEQLARIFQPFFRVDDSRNGATGGIGLGLAIAMRAVRLHHGSIEAANAQPGLLVTIKVPVEQREPFIAR
ncbi:MAG TPA: ATP-binding protein [Bryobacteraceae bacterium]|jgi:signal transduction histidine kinase|nr:ATP-binding protein [Bryobacteraceae bacterium]